jgi:uncharacterized protein (TIGR02118 family)
MRDRSSAGFRLIVLYREAVEAPDLRGLPDVTGCLFNRRTEAQLPDAQVPALERVLEVCCATPHGLEVAAARVAAGAPPLAMLATVEHVLVDRGVTPDAAKGVFLFRRRPDLPLAEFQRYWLEHHGPIASRTPDIQSYVQCHLLPESYAREAPRYDGVTELYWPDFATMVRSMRSPEMTVEQSGDAPNFVAPGSVDILTVQETRLF